MRRSIILNSLLLLISMGADAATIDATSNIQAVKGRKYGPYVGVFGGETESQTAKVTLGGSQGDVQNKAGKAFFGIEVGYSWKTGTIFEPALEFEAFYMGSEVGAQSKGNLFGDFLRNQTSNAGRGAGTEIPSKVQSTDTAAFITDINAVVFMLNAQVSLDFKPIEPWIPNKTLAQAVTAVRPYVGAGVGGAQLWFRNTEAISYGELLDAAREEFAPPEKELGRELVEEDIYTDGLGDTKLRRVTKRFDSGGKLIEEITNSGLSYSGPATQPFPEVEGITKVDTARNTTDLSNRPTGFKRVAYVTTYTRPDGTKRIETRYTLDDATLAGLDLNNKKDRKIFERSLRAAQKKKRAQVAQQNPALGANGLFSEDQFVFAYQWYAGVELKLNQRFSIFGEYRSITLDKFDPVGDFNTELWNAGIRLRY
jgi:opacity protein-like surface antigen